MRVFTNRLLAMLLLLSVILTCLVACNNDTPDVTDAGTEAPKPQHEHVDYVEKVKLDMSSDTLKQEVTVKFFIDGDTTHFNVPVSLDKTGVMKARYLAVNTPESTGALYREYRGF